MQHLNFERFRNFLPFSRKHLDQFGILESQRTPAVGRPGPQDGPTAENLTMFQAFEWYAPADQKHWQRLYSILPQLKEVGVSNMWIPPGCKATSPKDNGYGIYDLYDLGEFHQKGTRPTKWGSKEDLLQLFARADELGVGVYWDTILNHKAAADHTEKCMAVEVDPDDRTVAISRPHEIEAWIGFDFPGRGDKYSSQKYQAQHFNGTDYDALTRESAIYLINGKKWSQFVEKVERGNYDYLMFANFDHTHPEVREDMKRWGEWLGTELKLSGLRLDAVKHYSYKFLLEFIEHMERTAGPKWFFVAEFWKPTIKGMREYLSHMEYKVSLFDSPLVYNFGRTSQARHADLRKVFEGTLVQHEPRHAVTLVMFASSFPPPNPSTATDLPRNHDTQPTQPLTAPFSLWFKPLAYALILLRRTGYPCVFYGDLYGIASYSFRHPHYEPPACNGKLPRLCLLRKLYAYGPQIDYFDAPTCIGFTRIGTWDRPDGLACIMSNGGNARKKMFVGVEHAGEVWGEVLGFGNSEGAQNVVIDASGNGVFACCARSVAVWVRIDAQGRERLDMRFDTKIYG